MKAVILAAGTGGRLGNMAKLLPKCLIEIEGKSLIELSLDRLKQCGVDNVILVVGYYSGMIIKKIGYMYNGITITYIKNHAYRETESMYSLSRIKGVVNEDILLLESDLLYEKRAVEILINSNYRDVTLVSSFLNSGDDVYICIDDKNHIVNIGKNIPKQDKSRAIGSLVGISKFSKEFLVELFFQAEQKYLNNEMNYGYEECILHAALNGNHVYTEFCKDLVWIEVDTKEDLERAVNIVYPKIKGKINE